MSWVFWDYLQCFFSNFLSNWFKKSTRSAWPFTSCSHWFLLLHRFLRNWKAQRKNDPLIFRPFLKVFRSSWILACGLSFTRYTLFFRWFALRFREITYAKNLEFCSGFHWMRPKQKKPFVSSKQYRIEDKTKDTLTYTPRYDWCSI